MEKSSLRPASTDRLLLLETGTRIGVQWSSLAHRAHYQVSTSELIREQVGRLPLFHVAFIAHVADEGRMVSE